jgi:hypothetical protein
MGAGGNRAGRPQLLFAAFVVGLVVVLTGALVGLLRRAADDPCDVLVIHGGGFRGGPLAYGSGVIHAMPDIRATDVHYTCGTVQRAYADVMKVAYSMRDREHLVAYGESAGGTIAAWLASWGLLDNATTVGAVMDLRTWVRESKISPTQLGLRSYADAWSYSPAAVYRQQRPVFQYHFSEDPFVNPHHSQVLPGSLLMLMRGFGHAYMGDAETVAAVRRACNTAARP